jgi:hypothetical protein
MEPWIVPELPLVDCAKLNTAEAIFCIPRLCEIAQVTPI